MGTEAIRPDPERLIEDSPERSRVEADGVEVASDGLEFEVAATEPVGA